MRVCRKRGCSTILSRFNTGWHCFRHSEPVLPPHRVMSDRFVANVIGAYRLTPREQHDYETGQS